MKVEIINPEVVKDLCRNHGEFARVCYGSPAYRAEAVGRSCEETGHMSGSRCEYVKFRVEGVDRGTAEQCLRHEIGVRVPFEMQDNYLWAEEGLWDVVRVSPDEVVKNMASFRYIDKGGFDYAVPGAVRRIPEAEALYRTGMAEISRVRSELKRLLTGHGVDGREAVEAVNMLLPRATATEFVIGMTPEALIHFAHKRLCSRAQEFARELAGKMRAAVADLNPELAERLVPQCDALLYCPEGRRSCGRAPTRDEAMRILERGRRT